VLTIKPSPTGPRRGSIMAYRLRPPPLPAGGNRSGVVRESLDGRLTDRRHAGKAASAALAGIGAGRGVASGTAGAGGRAAAAGWDQEVLRARLPHQPRTGCGSRRRLDAGRLRGCWMRRARGAVRVRGRLRSIRDPAACARTARKNSGRRSERRNRKRKRRPREASARTERTAGSARTRPSLVTRRDGDPARAAGRAAVDGKERKLAKPREEESDLLAAVTHVPAGHRPGQGPKDGSQRVTTSAAAEPCLEGVLIRQTPCRHRDNALFLRKAKNAHYLWPSSQPAGPERDLNALPWKPPGRRRDAEISRGRIETRTIRVLPARRHRFETQRRPCSSSGTPRTRRKASGTPRRAVLYITSLGGRTPGRPARSRPRPLRVEHAHCYAT